MNILVKRRRRVFPAIGTLPSKPSELIRIALADLRKMEKAKTRINMDSWLVVPTDNKNNKICSVCLAGAVMACRLKADMPEVCYTFSGKQEYLPSQYDENRALLAIDNLRKGYLQFAFDDLGLDLPGYIKENVDIVPYNNKNKAKFKRQMGALAKALEAQGF